MNWNPILAISDVDAIAMLSVEHPIVIFKHSTRCSISDIAKSRLEKAKQPDNISFYFLDLLQYREVSNYISEKFHVFHESPQVLLIKNGECIYDQSHIAIQMDDLLSQV